MVGDWILYAVRLQGVLKVGITMSLTKRLATYATSNRRSQIEVIAAANLVAQTKTEALQTETALHLALEQVDHTRERELFALTHRTLQLAKDFIGFERDRYIEFLVSTRPQIRRSPRLCSVE